MKKINFQNINRKLTAASCVVAASAITMSVNAAPLLVGDETADANADIATAGGMIIALVLAVVGITWARKVFGK